MNQKNIEAQRRLRRILPLRIPSACLVPVNLCDPAEVLDPEALVLRNQDLEFLAQQRRTLPDNWDTEAVT